MIEGRSRAVEVLPLEQIELEWPFGTADDAFMGVNFLVVLACTGLASAGVRCRRRLTPTRGTRA